uniref:Uncharacterized protein n=1 Tax=Chlamydomonas leiostraca TaxID=1034604 RepID=A0A7S0WJX5_9CHLO|mmetsp:Transcript_15732/g.39246  ORF Transcript_15732/g.39246 Transcript_15732/m.39246 type:complete len:220 (+) Transcript_15732:151-810(+)|eukprot:CAMPEP_0202877154 /NCGR_PEP_ID=MMETSP1391-20130828/30201_1 /ASSEMBLY_ACC=CAM_ASM_000867 /TAXON_ID=1034604 /ORGANISM="Chlamydomonas leiostraca, Strain SAG 11-49" /LENGTH=219 /DNA_ID=CAMNT_0049559129 /DNA_START=91 /DNA_END=750 /DNA_ORIENTATION=+
MGTSESIEDEGTRVRKPKTPKQLLIGATATAIGLVLGTCTDSISVGEDSRFIALAISFVLGGLVALSPLMDTLRQLIYGPDAASTAAGAHTAASADTLAPSETSAAPAAATKPDGSGSKETSLRQRGGSGKKGSEPQTTSQAAAGAGAAGAASAAALGASATAAAGPRTKQVVAKQGRQQLAGFAVMVIALTATFGLVGPAGILTVASFTAAVRCLAHH